MNAFAVEESTPTASPRVLPELTVASRLGVEPCLLDDSLHSSLLLAY